MKMFYEGSWIEEQEFISLKEMANLIKKDTGIEHPIWVGISPSSHGPRIKVFNSKNKVVTDEGDFSITISDKPKIVSGIDKTTAEQTNKIFEFIKLNKDGLLSLSKNEITKEEFLKTVKRV